MKRQHREATKIQTISPRAKKLYLRWDQRVAIWESKEYTQRALSKQIAARSTIFLRRKDEKLRELANANVRDACITRCSIESTYIALHFFTRESFHKLLYLSLVVILSSYVCVYVVRFFYAILATKEFTRRMSFLF